MAALPYMQLYVADYLADTQHLTTEEHGAYILLIFSYWQTGKPLRIDRLATVARMSNERWESVEETLAEFFHVVGAHWHHFRIDADLEAVNSKSSQASNAGKASAKARALKKQQELNGRSTGAATNVDETYQRNGNHTDTDTDTDIKALVIAAANDSGDQKEQPAKADPIPYESIFDAYATTLQTLPQVRIKDEARRKAIRSLWRSDPRFQNIDFWHRYYGSVRESKFLMGMNGIGFDWLMKPANFKKVVEGNYA